MALPSLFAGSTCFLPLLLLLILQPLSCNADNITNPMSIFYSRPDLIAPIMTIEQSKPELLSPGYFFLGAYQVPQEGPYIYDNGGNLIWSGFGSGGPGAAHAIHVCNYHDEPHLCFFQGNQMLGYGKGHGVIMDKHYRIVRSVEAAGAGITADLHEFNLLPDGKSALMTAYQTRAYDLSAYGILGGLGWIQEGIFQEVDVETGELLFEWRSLEHVDPSNSFVLPGTTEISGDGLTKDTPWDYLHINSIDKNEDGDYLISLRHTSTIMKISGTDGSIIWQLNGISSDFKLEEFTFAYQHDARWISNNDTHAVISFFDNASNGFDETAPFSRGLIVVIDLIERIARISKQYDSPAPHGGMQAKSQGNSQILPDGHVVSGWGNNCFITEHLPDGTPIFYGWTAMTGQMIYRVYKAEWHAEPLTLPNVWSFSKSRHRMVFYASWNGATEVTHWNFYTSDEKNGTFELVATAPKDGFETIYAHEGYSKFVYAEAMHNDISLKNSSIEQTFVPGPALVQNCHDYGCPTSPPPPSDEAERIRLEQIAAQEAIMQSTRLQDQRARKALMAAVAQITGSMMVLLGLVLLSRKKFRCKCAAWLNGCKDIVVASHSIGVAKLQLWRSGYQHNNSGEYTRLDSSSNHSVSEMSQTSNEEHG